MSYSKFNLTLASAVIALGVATSTPVVAAIVKAKATATAEKPLSAASAPKALDSAPQSKEQLVTRLLQLWHVESVALSMLHAPIEESLRQSRSLLQGRLSSEKQAQAMKDITGYAEEFFEKTTPLVLERAKKLIPLTVAPILAEKFTEDELRQIIAMLEAPVKAKFEALVPELQKALGQKIAAEEASEITPKMETLQQRIGLRLRAAVTP